MPVALEEIDEQAALTQTLVEKGSHEQTPAQEELTWKQKAWLYLISILGAAGTALQNYMAVVALLKDIMDGAFAATKIGLGLMHGLALSLGGFCSGLVNLWINIDLLKSFYVRITQKKIPKLEGWQKFRYWFGSGIFVVTGVLFGLTTFAFGSLGVLAAISVAAGIFVAAIMMIQELETWLASFDDANQKNLKTIKQIFNEWWKSLTKGKLIGHVIAVGNVVALSLLFTMGLASFLIGVGLPALPAVMIGFAVAFTGGAFTEFYFYNKFLADFCGNIKQKWLDFWHSKYSQLGLVCSALNGLANGVLYGAAIMMLAGLLTAASLAVPPVGVIVAVAAVSAVFGGLASFILGLDFWTRNSKDLPSFFSKKISPVVEKDDSIKPNANVYVNANSKKITFNSETTVGKNAEDELEEPLLEKKQYSTETMHQSKTTQGLKHNMLLSHATHKQSKNDDGYKGYKILRK